MTSIPGPLLLLALPLLAAIAVYLVRRWALLAAFLSAVTTGVLALLCLSLPLDRVAFVVGQEVAFGRPVVILGLTLMLEPAGQAWLAFAFALTTFLYLFAWRLSQGRSFFPFSLVILSLYALIALLQSLSLAVIVLAISATLAVFILQGGQPGSTRGAQRYLLITLLAVPLILAAGWLADQPSPTSAALLSAGLGFGLLLAIVPFSTWMPALAADAPPIVAAFVFTVGQGMVVFLMVTFLHGHPAALNEPVVLAMAQLAGLLMAVVGGLMAAVQRDLGRLFGYLALGDLGYFLLAWGTGSSQSLTLALLHLVNRAIPIILMASALAIIRHRATTDAFTGLRGMVRRLPFSATGLIVGGLALAGFPGTAGFPTHWAVLRAVMSGEWAWAQVLSPESAGLILIVASGGIVVGLLRGLGAMLGNDIRPEIGKEPAIASAMVLILTGLVIVIGLYPQLFLKQALAMF
jgi:formate hydrogenlyase subunit 3/multisubunit Na+/H+ antiporter MnhD subunit